MTNMQLLEAIGMLDEQTVLDAEKPVAKILPAPRARMIRQISAIAACVCLLFGGALALQMGGMRTKSEEPAAPADGTPTLAAGTMSSVADLAENPTGDEPNMTTVAATTEATTAATYVTTTTAAWTTTTGGGYHTTKRDEPNVTTAGATSQTGFPATEAAPEVSVPKEGLNVYYERFDTPADTEDTAAALQAAGMSRLTVASNGVYSETNAAFALRDGRLYFDNITPEGSGSDGYYCMDALRDRSLMNRINMGKYTLQYDLEYVNAANVSRYAVIITELSEDGQCYNSFHLRIGGLANHQCHFYGNWKTFSAYDPATDLNPSADDPTGAEGTPLISKLLGLDIAQVSEQMNLKNVRLTVRLQWDPEMGHHVYLKTADMADFIKVSAPSVNADGPIYMGWVGWCVALKLGGGIEGYLDNIHIWTGWGEEPSADGEWYQPR